MPSNTANLVKFGLKNVYVAFATYDTATSTYSYGNPQQLVGAVNLSLDPSGDSSEFYADDIAFFTQAANAGYSGKLEIANIPDWFRVSALGEVVDTNGVQLERAGAQQQEFAMMYEINGDQSGTRFITYRTNVARPALTGETTGKTITPKTDEMTLNAMPRLNDQYVKGFVHDTTANHTIYAGWYTAVTQPAALPTLTTPSETPSD